MAEELGKIAKLAKKTATLAGCSIEIQILKQQVVKQQEEINRTQNLFMTLQAKFVQFEQQRAIELSQALGGGPTVRE